MNIFSKPRYSEQVRSKYTTDYFLNSCGGVETPAFDENCPLPRRLAQVFRMAALKRGEDVLDLGCGRGELVHEAAKLGCKAVGVDYSFDAIAIAQQGARGTSWEAHCRFILARTDEDCFADEQFDVIVSSDVFEHLHRDELQLLLATVKKRLRSGGRFVFHTSPNRFYYSVAYRAVYELSRASGKSSLSKNSRSSHEDELHIGELTQRDVEELFAEAGLKCQTSLFGLERILQSIEESGLGPGARRRLASWACYPQLRTFTNSDIAGVGAHESRILDSCYVLNHGSDIPLDHPFFFQSGWYVPVNGTDPHRWTSPHFSVKGVTGKDARLRLLFRSWPGHTTRLEVKFPGRAARTFVVGDGAATEIGLEWPETRLPITVHFTAESILQVANDPRLFGVCLSKIIGPTT